MDIPIHIPVVALHTDALAVPEQLRAVLALKAEADLLAFRLRDNAETQLQRMLGGLLRLQPRLREALGAQRIAVFSADGVVQTQDLFLFVPCAAVHTVFRLIEHTDVRLAQPVVHNAG